METPLSKMWRAPTNAKYQQVRSGGEHPSATAAGTQPCHQLLRGEFQQFGGFAGRSVQRVKFKSNSTVPVSSTDSTTGALGGSIP